ncbi:MAG TPA: glycogen/starch/alpha-glucan phosphorylase [Acetobacteraceae bacterium]|nr:glycogen/starch/alpha-glucan phosphorylase [Acetobacteraceae bacterium]
MSQTRTRINPRSASSVAPRIALPTQDEDVASLRRSIVAKLTYSVGRDPIVAAERDWFIATALAVRDRIVERWVPATRAAYTQGRKRVYYLSLEFLIGRLLYDSLNNLSLVEPIRTALAELDVDFDRLRELEPDAALGNGGLGRLAACYMDSLAALAIPTHGYGIRYDHGLFRQVIRDGWQQEFPENWLSFGNPWEFPRPDLSHMVGFGGAVEMVGSDGSGRAIWHPAETVVAVAYDTPVVGWRGNFVNTLRLWSARAPDPIMLDAFNRGDHVGALAAGARANAISQILYPSDETPAGQELRLRQEYFFSSASLQNLVFRHLRQHRDVRTLAQYCAIQLNDTHPAIAVPELMRLLVDVHEVDWHEAWAVTKETFCYTNHTLLPEALETWPVPLMERLLPRHMQIIYQINAEHLDGLVAVRRLDAPPLDSVSLIDEHSGRRVRMGHLAFLGSRRVNGVSALHSELMRQTVFRPMHTLYPDRIVNVTNGISFRRWLFDANPGLTDVLIDAIGPELLDNAEALSKLAPFADDAALHEKLRAVRRSNKQVLAMVVAERLNLAIDPDAMFDVHVKRFHEYKRQLLNILQTIWLYNAMRAQPTRDWVPRVKIFAGKAAASYRIAKLVIKLIHDVARVVNNDPTLRGRLKVVFLPDYNVSLAEAIMPSADLSEQISTAGMEASGTGNMKLALNGALTIGTVDGANIELRDHVGAENMFLFGLSAEEVQERRLNGPPPRETIAASPVLQEVLDAIGGGVFSHDDPQRYAPIIEGLTSNDWFMVAADFESYAEAQLKVSTRWHDQPSWWRSSVLNTANVGWFSSDRSIREYATELWRVAV